MAVLWTTATVLADENEIHRRLRALGLAPKHAEDLILVEARGFDLRTDLHELEAPLRRYEPDDPEASSVEDSPR